MRGGFSLYLITTKRSDNLQYLLLTLKGIAIGAANIVPGVSGATLAVIFRVYDRLIEAINNLFKEPKRSLQFLIPFGIGMAIGVLTLVSALDFFLQRFSFQSGAFIAGLMAGSIPFIHNVALSKDKKKPYSYPIAIIAAIAIIALSLFVPTQDVYIDIQINFSFVALMVIGGIFSAVALMFPGVSGAMVLLLFGIFHLAIHTLNLIREYLMTPFDFSLLPPILMVVLPIGLGLLIGVFLTSRLIAFLLERHHGVTYFAIIGMIFGTVFALFSNDATYQSHSEITVGLIFFAALAFIMGMAVSFIFGKK